MAYLKYINYVLCAAFISVFLFMVLRSIKNGMLEKKIKKDGVYVNGIITAVMPGTPTTNGLVNITVDYSFIDRNGMTLTREKVLTVVKTVDLGNYQVGAGVPVIYLRGDSSKHVLRETKGLLDK